MCNHVENFIKGKLRCSCCKLIRDVEEFSRGSNIMTGYSYTCKQCEQGMRKLKYFHPDYKPFIKFRREIIDGKCKCAKCKKDVDISNFTKDSRNLCGLCTYCKDCKFDLDKQFRDNHPNYSKLQKEYKANSQAVFKEKNKELSKIGLKVRSAYKFKNKYGITTEDYIKFYESQNGVCAICGKEETVKSQNGQIRPLSVDHCHETNVFRGLLCTQCNQGIGCLKDNVEILQKAIDYINKAK